MILGFFGKGGSGKTTTSFRFIQSIEQMSKLVLAVDVDHNMDLTYNFGFSESLSCLGADATLGAVSIEATEYSLSSREKLQAQYLHSVSERVSLVIAGPHTEPIFQGEFCSHGLLKPIIEFVSRLRLQVGEHVVIDTTAGMDSIGAGLPACLQVGIVCVEPTIHSIKVGHQLVDGLARLHVPSVVVANKLQTNEELQEVQASFAGKRVIPISWYAGLCNPKTALTETEQVMYRAIFEAAETECVQVSTGA